MLFNVNKETADLKNLRSVWFHISQQETLKEPSEPHDKVQRGERRQGNQPSGERRREGLKMWRHAGTESSVVNLSSHLQHLPPAAAAGAFYRKYSNNRRPGPRLWRGGAAGVRSKPGLGNKWAGAGPGLAGRWGDAPIFAPVLWPESPLPPGSLLSLLSCQRVSRATWRVESWP